MKTQNHELLRKHNRLFRLHRRIEALGAQYEALAKELQKECPHRSIIETPPKPNIFGNLGGHRICLVCLLEDTDEGGWAGYSKLKRQPVQIINNRDEFYKFRDPVPLRATVTFE